MNSVLGWFPHSPVEWIELIIIALLLWLLMVVAISELEMISVQVAWCGWRLLTTIWRRWTSQFHHPPLMIWMR